MENVNNTSAKTTTPSLFITRGYEGRKGSCSFDGKRISKKVANQMIKDGYKWVDQYTGYKTLTSVYQK